MFLILGGAGGAEEVSKYEQLSKPNTVNQRSTTPFPVPYP